MAVALLWLCLALAQDPPEEDPAVEVPKGDESHFRKGEWKKAEEAIRKARQAVVRLYLRGNMGSGVVVRWKGGLYFFSVAHNFAAGEIDEIQLPAGGAKCKVEKVAIDAGADVAVFKIVDPPKDLPFVEVNDKPDLKRGSPVLALSYPLGRGLKKGFPVVDVGLVTSTEKVVSARDVYVAHRAGVPDGMQVTVGPGSSGGGLFDVEGRLVGIIRMVSGEKEQGVVSAIPVSALLGRIR